MDKCVYIAPSTDPVSDNKQLIKYVKKMNKYADFIHCDVMDGIFVEKKSINQNIVKQIFKNTCVPLDVHLMVNNPEKEVIKYINAGAQIVTIHYEACKNKSQIKKILNIIKKHHRLAGLSICPSTDVEEISDLLGYTDLVLVMSVVPGKSGQSFIENIYEKIKKLKNIKNQFNANYLIEVDGGVNNLNNKKLIECGADILVSGSYIYNAEDMGAAINSLKN